MHGEEWDGKKDLTGWWMSEKLDGVRAYWDGKKMFSRHGKEINCLDEFLDGLPKGTPLDGELWMGRGTVEKLIGTLNSPSQRDWKLIKYMVFDLPKSSE